MSHPRRSIPTSNPSLKDANGAFLKAEGTPSDSPPSDLPPDSKDRTDDIDAMLKSGLYAVYRAMRLVHESLATGKLDRNAVMSLKDIMGILKSLKEDEKDLLDSMDEEELKKLSE